MARIPKAVQLLSEITKLTFSQYQEAEQFYVAYSGGLDSRVLLHLCASLSSVRQKITAVYVHHGLQAEADDWAEHCAETAELEDVRFIKLHVDGRPEPGESGEEAARNARYRALKSLLNTGDILLTGQHREDQLETILLQLFRGAGLSGLSGMPGEAAFGKGKIVRPLLNVSKRDFEEYAQRLDLTWVEDPSNRECDYDRNYLRNCVIPLLKERWPSIDKTVFRAGVHCAEAQTRISCFAGELLRCVLDESTHTLKIDRLLILDRYDRQLVVREWFRTFGLRMPSAGLIGQILDQVVDASQGRDPKLQRTGFSVRRYRERLYLLSDVRPINPESFIAWPADQTYLQLEHNGRLQLTAKAGPGLSAEAWAQAQVAVHYRQGGESIRLPGRDGSHTLKKLFQEAGVPPWIRERMPLVYLDEKLASVGGEWIDAEFYRLGNGDNLSLQWLQHNSSPKNQVDLYGVD